MVIKKLNFEWCKEYISTTEICFVKILGSKLYRMPYIPAKYCRDPVRLTELIQVLNTVCLRFRDNIWYFKADTNEDMLELGSIFVHMDIDPVFVEMDPYGRDDNFEMLPQVYN